MEIFKNILFDVWIVVGLIALDFTTIWWLLEILNRIFKFSKYIIMYNQYKKKEDLYDLRNKVIVAKDGEISYSCVGDIDEKIEILNKGIKYCERIKNLNKRLTEIQRRKDIGKNNGCMGIYKKRSQ